jgi:hypothetical protein
MATTVMSMEVAADNEADVLALEEVVHHELGRHLEAMPGPPLVITRP